MLEKIFNFKKFKDQSYGNDERGRKHSNSNYSTSGSNIVSNNKGSSYSNSEKSGGSRSSYSDYSSCKLLVLIYIQC